MDLTKTICCNSKWYRKSRVNFRCKECGKDVTLEVVLLYEELQNPHYQIN